MTAPVPAGSRLVFLLFLTLIFGGLNALKPLTIDDPAYFYYARQMAAHPLDPYGFNLVLYQEPNRALDVLAPPLLPYTWAAGLFLFGEHPVPSKLLLLPWSFLLVWAVHALFRRFVAGLELPLTVLTILSPALWPSLNLMLDIPALGLTLAAIELFLRACDDGGFGKAACAGLLAGLGFETKYTACVAVAVFVLAALVRRRIALGIVAVLLALHVICAWEFLMASLYHYSHFFNSFGRDSSPDTSWFMATLDGLVLSKGPLFTCFLSLLGGVTPALLLMGLASLGLRRWWLFFTLFLFLTGLLIICLFDSRFEGMLAPSPSIFGPQKTPPLHFELADVIFAVFGGTMLLAAGLVFRSLLRSSSGPARWEVWLLVGWLTLEVAAFFPLTPFPAVRRILGILVVLTLLLGRHYAQQLSGEQGRRLLWCIVGFSVTLGFGLFALDYRDADVERQGAAEAAAWVRDHGGGRVWYTGHWGFQYYAELHGMQAVIPEYNHYGNLPPPTRLQQGDWLVLPDDRIMQQQFRLDPEEVQEVTRLTIDDWLPLRTVPNFHGTPDPVQHQERPRFQVRIFRVERDFLPRYIKPPQTPLK